MRALLGGAPKDQKRSVVLFGEELERGGVLEGVDRVLFCEFLGQRLAQLEEVVQGVLDDLRASGTTEEKNGFGVLDGLRCALCEGALGAGITRFAIGQRFLLGQSSGREYWLDGSLHLSQHLCGLTT